ncbi:hypothetical protein JCM8547_004815 [Rhodosporidiobolus lusitaniae]
MMSRKLSPDGRRLRTIIITTPFVVASSILLYKRLVLGEEQKHLPRPGYRRAQAAAQAQQAKKMSEGEFEGMPEELRRQIRQAEEAAKR